ncbi:cora-like Mg2+ transporter protein-domain-containing protein [Biscogniauxia sp. FL1348]|nr:cora-like Mg2+ transporter protein-domain-containing protein [Biscogniauxia sp. FL1348]
MDISLETSAGHRMLFIDSSRSMDHRRWEYSVCVTVPSNGRTDENEKFSIRWMVIDETNHWRSPMYLTSLPHLWIPRNGTEFFQKFIEYLRKKWVVLCNDNQVHQDYVRERIFLDKSNNPRILDALLENGKRWLKMRRSLNSDVTVARKFGLNHGIRHKETESSSKLFQTINEWSEDITERIDRLEESSKGLIQLEFNLVSNNEARKSTTMSISMNRLSWITFVFLPLTFVSGIFGMNVDAFASNPPWGPYPLFATATLLITFMTWFIFKRNPNLQLSLERRLAWLLGLPEDPEYDSTEFYDFIRYHAPGTRYRTFLELRSLQKQVRGLGI